MEERSTMAPLLRGCSGYLTDRDSERSGRALRKIDAQIERL